MPFYMFHSIYYQYFLYQKSLEKKPPEEKKQIEGAQAIEEAMEDYI